MCLGTVPLFGTVQVDSNAYYKAAKQDFMTMIRPENLNTPSGMLTYVGNDQTADIRTMLDPGQGALAPVDGSWHIAYMFASSRLKSAKLPVYENPAVVVFSYQKRLKRFLHRAMRAAHMIRC